MTQVDLRKSWRSYSQRFRIAAKAAGRSQDYVRTCLTYAKRLHDRQLPIIFDQEHLSKLMGVDITYLRACSNAPDRFYRRFKIAKRSGKEREIAAPLPTLMAAQKWILDNIINRVPSSKYAKAYVQGKSIRDNARFHLRQSVVLKVDIEEFFHSIGVRRVYTIFRDMGYSQSVAALCAGLVTLDQRLPQGAPTSPALSNLVCRRIDARISSFCIRRDCRFTRYADDITVSGKFEPGQVIEFIRTVVGEDGFSLKDSKTRVLRPHQSQVVTGVVVNEYQQSPRVLRRRLRQAAYFIDRYGLSDHMSMRMVTQTNYRAHLIGLARHVLFLSSKDRDATKLLQTLTTHQKW